MLYVNQSVKGKPNWMDRVIVIAALTPRVLILLPWSAIVFKINFTCTRESCFVNTLVIWCWTWDWTCKLISIIMFGQIPSFDTYVDEPASARLIAPPKLFLFLPSIQLRDPIQIILLLNVSSCSRIVPNEIAVIRRNQFPFMLSHRL